MKLMNNVVVLAFVFAFGSCNSQNAKSDPASLKNAFKTDFYIGTALSADQIDQKDATVNALIRKEFNAITAENIMKSMFIHPEKDKYDFAMTDKFVSYGKKNKMFIHGGIH